MADMFKVLGQLYPAAATLTTLYTVPAATSTSVSTLTVCNRSGTAADSFSVSVQIAGAADSNQQYLYTLLPIQPNDTFATTIGITLATTDVVKCYSTNGTCSFNLFGVQIT